MSGHLRRRAATRLVIAAIALTIPAAWAIGRGRAAILRARWAWRCRGKPPIPGHGIDRLTASEIRALRKIGQYWKHPAPPERSRT